MSITATLQATGTVTSSLRETPVIPPVAVQTKLSLTAQLEGQPVAIRAGLGMQDITLDVTVPLASVTRTLSAIWAIVVDPDEKLVEYTAAAPAAAAAEGDGNPEIYTQTVKNLACQDEVRTKFAFRHEFAQRGTHSISVRFEFSNGDYITTPDAVRVACGDGLHEDYR